LPVMSRRNLKENQGGCSLKKKRKISDESGAEFPGGSLNIKSNRVARRGLKVNLIGGRMLLKKEKKLPEKEKENQPDKQNALQKKG